MCAPPVSRLVPVVDFTLNPENFQAKVVMELDPSVKITEDATAKVSAEGLLGSKFISLEQGGAETMLADGGVISNTQGAVDIWSLISQAMFERKDSTTPAADTVGTGDPVTPVTVVSQPDRAGRSGRPKFL